MRRSRYSKIIATLGPSSDSYEQIEGLFLAGVDVFRLNFSHGAQQDHKEKFDYIRKLEKVYNRPICILADLQGPKLRVGTFEDGNVFLKKGQTFRLDLDKTPGNSQRVCLPHPELYKALDAGAELLLDDGKLSLVVISRSDDQIITEVVTEGILSNRKGVNIPNVMLPISVLTKKDLEDLDFALNLGVDFIGLSFVQRPSDVTQAREIIGKRAGIITKLEKPLALDYLPEIIEVSDGIMIARGDLGVEMQPEDLPSIQRRIIRECRKVGKPVIVATQMLESMIATPKPTRAEASDVATAIYEGADAVMLSAESASGKYPIEAVSMMNRIIEKTEQDPICKQALLNDDTLVPHTVTDSIAAAANQVAKTIKVACIVTLTESGFTALRVAKERPFTPILSLTTNILTGRKLALVWGVHPTIVRTVAGFSDMVDLSTLNAQNENFASPGDKIIITAGMPFGETGGTNIVWVETI